jgi:hypothetical protein
MCRRSEDAPAPAAVTIHPVTDERTLRDWVEVAGATFGEPAGIQWAHYALQLDLGVVADLPLHCSVASPDGQPVATSARLSPLE